MEPLTLQNMSDLLDTKLNALKEDISKDMEVHKNEINASILAQNQAIKTVEDSVSKVQKEVQDNETASRARSLMLEFERKRFNILIGGIEDPQIFEKRSQCEALARDFLTNILGVERATNIRINDCHRLPQRPVVDTERPRTRNAGTPKRRIMIVKLASLIDKASIFGCLKDLRDINQSREKGTKYFVSDHLPKSMKEDKDSLMEEFRQAKVDKLSPYFKADVDTGDYCLHIGKRVVKPVKPVKEDNAPGKSTS